MRPIRSHASYQRELNAKSRAWTTGCAAVLAAAVMLVVGVCCVWNDLGGAV